MTGTPEPNDDELRDAVRRALREPVDVDPARREAAVATALDAADDAAVVPLAPRRTRRGHRPLLVAAAVLAVLGIGTLAVVSGGGSGEQLATGGGDDAASVEGAAELEEAPLVEPDAALDAEEGDAAAEGAEGVAPSPPSTIVPAGPLVDLGEHSSHRDVLAAAGELSDSTTADRGSRTSTTAVPEPSTCELQLLAQGWTPVATAAVRSSAVYVAVNGEGSSMVVDADSCRPYDAP